MYKIGTIDPSTLTFRERLVLEEVAKTARLYEDANVSQLRELELIEALAKERREFQVTESSRLNARNRQLRRELDCARLENQTLMDAKAETETENREIRLELGDLELENAILRARLGMPMRPSLLDLN